MKTRKAWITVLALILMLGLCGGLIAAGPMMEAGGSAPGSQVNIIATKFYDENGDGIKNQTGAIEYWLAGFEFRLYEYIGTADEPGFYPTTESEWQYVGTQFSAVPNGQAPFGMQPHGWHRVVEILPADWACTTYPISHEYVWLTTDEVQSDIWFGNQEIPPPPPPIPPDVRLVKSVTPSTLPEPGGDFVFTLTIFNDGTEPFTITSLTDTNLSEPYPAAILALIGQVVPAGGSVSASYTITHTLVGVYDNTAVVVVEADNGLTDQDEDTASVSVTPVVECHTETAWADGDRYVDSSWATYTAYVANNTVTLFAGQFMEAGTVHFSPVVDGMVTITITLNEGWQFADVAENVKIQDYAEPPTDNPSPGDFAWKFDAAASPFEALVAANLYYGVHVEVMYCE